MLFKYHERQTCLQSNTLYSTNEKGQHVLAKHNHSWSTLIILRNEIDVHNVFCIIILLQKEIRETYVLKAGFTPKIHNMKHGMLRYMNVTTCISELWFFSR